MWQQFSMCYNSSILQMFIFAEGHETSNKPTKTARLAMFSLLSECRPSHSTRLPLGSEAEWDLFVTVGNLTEIANKKEDQIKRFFSRLMRTHLEAQLHVQLGFYCTHHWAPLQRCCHSWWTVTGWTLTEFLKGELSLIFLTYFHNDKQYML